MLYPFAPSVKDEVVLPLDLGAPEDVTLPPDLTEPVAVALLPGSTIDTLPPVMWGLAAALLLLVAVGTVTGPPFASVVLPSFRLFWSNIRLWFAKASQ